ncbi:hypothetical protein HELRODRAFT_139327, partial [Helobdella robusta]|uniref:Cadherin domain-containing protein n=1 Tax=Helobdella robusta TaxID=6412 RepID=T1EIY4_HELRO
FVVQEETPLNTIVADLTSTSGFQENLSPAILKSLRYQFLTQPLPLNVELGEDSGVIKTSGRLDREGLCPLAPVCKVGSRLLVGEHFKILKITIEIFDINDNPPQFQGPNPQLFQLSESVSIGTILSLEPAVDADSDLYSVDRYELAVDDSPGGRFFDLKLVRKLDGSESLQLILTRRLDREAADEHTLQILAIDRGSPAKTGSCDVIVKVKDSNDNAPQFEVEDYEVTLPENAPLMTVVARVQATDKDADENAALNYRLSEQTQKHYGRTMNINNLTGEIFVVGEVDFEVTSLYKLVVVAQDGGVEPHSSEVLVVHHVTQISEEDVNGTFVAQILVTDADPGNNGRTNCHLDNHGFNLIRLSDAEYRVVTGMLLDREEQSRHLVHVECLDGGRTIQLSAEVTIVVEVADVNDNTPKFSQTSYQHDLPENNPQNTPLLQVFATDDDDGDNGRLSYYIENNNI